MANNRIAILFSGNGSNMQAIVSACQDGYLNASVVKLICNNPDAKGIQYALQQKMDCSVIDHRQCSELAEFEEKIIDLLKESQANWIVLAGFMRVLSARFVQLFRGRIVNIHPSLLPRHPGLNTHQKVIDSGDKEHGASVHFVTEGVDEGPLIMQEKITVDVEDTVLSLAEKVLAREHSLYIRALKLIFDQSLRADNENSYEKVS